MKTYILAQGQGVRWEKTKIPHKQLIPVGGLTIIERTLGMIDESTLVCTADFASHLLYGVNYVSLREPTSSILIGITELLGAEKPKEDVLLLLGDVIYSKAMLQLIMTNGTNSISFFGRMGKNMVTGKSAGEILAVRISLPSLELFASECARLHNNGFGKLWDYWNVHKSPFYEVRGDYTDDIDSNEEYEKFGNVLIGAALNEH